MDFLEVKPENVPPQSASPVQPAQEAFCQAGFANSSLAVYQNRRLGLADCGALQPLNIASSADKPIIGVHVHIFRQGESLSG